MHRQREPWLLNPKHEHPALAAMRKSGASKVKVAVSDIDGILRGKYLHRDKFSARRTAASAFAMSCSAGTRTTTATTTPQYRLAARPMRWPP